MRRAVFLILAFIIVAGIALLLNSETLELYREQNKLKRKATQDLREAEAKHAEIIKKKAGLSGPLGREELVRERGYKKPDEVTLDAGH